MAQPNSLPIYSRVGNIQWTAPLLLATNEYAGQANTYQRAFLADASNGGFVQRLRFKALGTNVATVARVFIGNGLSQLLGQSVTGTPTGTPSTTGGTMRTNAALFAKVVAIGPNGAIGPASTETTTTATTGPTASIAWAWTAVVGATSYRVYIGTATGAQSRYFTTATNSYTQTTDIEFGTPGVPALDNETFYDEVSLPATTGIATAGTVPVDLPMNFALDPGYEIWVGLATAVAAGWQVTTIGGKY